MPAPPFQITVTGLTNGVIQYFRVSAVNSAGQSPASNTLSATPVGGGVMTGTLAGTASDATAVINGDLSITSTLTATMSDATGALTGNIGFDLTGTITGTAGDSTASINGTITVVSPVLAAQNNEVGTSMGAQAINMPTGIASGNLLMAIAVNDNPGATNMSASSGWTQVGSDVQGSNVIKMAVFARIADGTATDNITITGAAQDYCAWTGRFTGFTVVDPATLVFATANAATGNGDSPNANPGVARSWLWISAEGVDLTTGNTITSVPSGYTSQFNNVSASSTSSVALAVATKTGNTTSEDPGTFTNNPTTRPWIAFTIGIPNLVIVPTAPTLTGVTPGNTQNILNWTAPTNVGGGAITGYLVEQSANGTTGWSTVTTTGNVLTYTHTALTNGVIVYYRVSAINSAGTGAVSNTASGTPSSAGPNLGYRLFNGSSDYLTTNLGNLVSVASIPETWMFAGRFLVFIGGGGEIVSAPSWDPTDFYVTVTGGDDLKVQFSNADGAGDATLGPIINHLTPTADGIVVFRRAASTAVRWSYATNTGSGWSAFAHTDDTKIFGNRNYPASGLLTFGNNTALNARFALVARCSTSLSDTEVNGLTAGLSAWSALSSITNLWQFDQTPVVDLKGTSTQNTLNGTSVTATAFPLPS